MNKPLRHYTPWIFLGIAGLLWVLAQTGHASYTDLFVYIFLTLTLALLDLLAFLRAIITDLADDIRRRYNITPKDNT